MINIGLYLVHVAQNVNLKIDNKGLLLVYVCAILPLEVMFLFVLRPGVDVVDMLRTAGYSSYRIAKEGIFGSATMQKFRKRGRPSWEELDKLVKLLHVSPVDLIAYQTDDGRVFDLTGRRLDTPAPPPFTVQHGHPGDAGYDPDDPGEYPDIDDDY